MLVSKHTSSKRLITANPLRLANNRDKLPWSERLLLQVLNACNICNVRNLLYEYSGGEAWNSEQAKRPQVHSSSHGLPPKEVLFCPFFIFCGLDKIQGARTYRASLI
ncbi:hypothetical protein V8C43DRAFT_274930 [Trichoderma afarasin]